MNTNVSSKWKGGKSGRQQGKGVASEAVISDFSTTNGGGKFFIRSTKIFGVSRHTKESGRTEKGVLRNFVLVDTKNPFEEDLATLKLYYGGG